MSYLRKPVAPVAAVITASLGDTQLVGGPLSLPPLVFLSSLVSNRPQRKCRYNVHCDKSTTLSQKNIKELRAKDFFFLQSAHLCLQGT